MDRIKNFFNFFLKTFRLGTGKNVLVLRGGEKSHKQIWTREGSAMTSPSYHRIFLLRCTDRDEWIHFRCNRGQRCDHLLRAHFATGRYNQWLKRNDKSYDRLSAALEQPESADGQNPEQSHYEALKAQNPDFFGWISIVNHAERLTLFSIFSHNSTSFEINI